MLRKRTRHVLHVHSAQLQPPAPTLSMLGGMALPPTPILPQSMWSPSSLKVRRPTTTPFSLATTCREDLGGPGRGGGGGQG